MPRRKVTTGRLSADVGTVRGSIRARRQTRRSTAIYAKLSQPTESRVVRMAALRGRLQTAGPEASQVIARALADDDPLVRQAAAGQLRNLSDQALRDSPRK